MKSISITRLKQVENGENPALCVPWNEKYLDYEIETDVKIDWQ